MCYHTLNPSFIVIFHSTAIDECAAFKEPCSNNGICTDGLKEYMCTCNKGFSGLMCEMNDTKGGYSMLLVYKFAA